MNRRLSETAAEFIQAGQRAVLIVSFDGETVHFHADAKRENDRLFIDHFEAKMRELLKTI